MVFRATLLVAFLVGAAPASAGPDLTIPRADLERDGNRMLVPIRNLGDEGSPATTLLVSDRPFLGGPTRTSSPYSPMSGETAVWIRQEPDGESGVLLILEIRVSRGRRSAGSVELLTQGRLEGLGPPDEGAPSRFFSWDRDTPPGGFELPFRVSARRGVPARVRISVTDPENVRVHTADGIRRGELELTLDALDQVRAARIQVDVPPVPPGGEITIAVEIPGAMGSREVGPFNRECWVWVDPDDEIREEREGNNVSGIGASDDWTQAALHIHSSFSEGAGSFGNQVHLAAQSGYDLVWWTEHDWRVTCDQHLEHVGFEADEPILLTEETKDGGGSGIVDGIDVRDGERSLHLRSSGERETVRLTTTNSRLAYTLASGIEVDLAFHLREFGPGDVFEVDFALSRHPGERRHLTYQLGSDLEERADPDLDPVFRRHVLPGGWGRVQFRLSEDAALRWPDGQDNNVKAVRFTLIPAAGRAAEVFVDDLRIRHERCGMELLEVQREWAQLYPNVRHLVGGEISRFVPHVSRYGATSSVLPYDGRRSTAGEPPLFSVPESVERVHASSGVASWCHPFFGKMTRKYGDLWEETIAGRFADADAIEVGYRARGQRSLQDHLELWDRVSVAGVVMTGLGVNDSHVNSWGQWESNFCTWLHASPDDEAALLDVLRNGDAFFGDPVAFRGRLELECGDARMGEIVGGEGPRHFRIILRADASERVVRLVADGDLIREWRAAGDATLEHELAPGAARVVRAEVWSTEGQPLAFTNPIWLDADGTAHRPRY